VEKPLANSTNTIKQKKDTKVNTKIVALSIAHYPNRAGASYKGVNEHAVSTVWISTLKRILESYGVIVIQTPVGGLRKKVKFINDHDSDVAVEIHFNGSSNPKVSGTETLYCPGSVKGKKFAEIVHSNYVKEMHCRDRGIKEGWYRMDRPYIEDYPGDIDGDEKKDYFLQYTSCPALIPEPEFIAQQDNINDNMESACIGIALGIIEFLET